MANIVAKVLMDLDWQPLDKLRLLIGSEHAADLASSVPAGGTVVLEESPWPDGGATRGGMGADLLGGAPLGFTGIGYGLGEGELGFGILGINDVPRRVLEHRYDPSDVCASLPVGVSIADQAGNVSAVLETTVEMRDTPRGARNPTVAPTLNVLEAELGWTQSPDV